MIAIKSQMNKHESRSEIGAFLVFPALTQINLQRFARLKKTANYKFAHCLCISYGYDLLAADKKPFKSANCLHVFTFSQSNLEFTWTCRVFQVQVLSKSRREKKQVVWLEPGMTVDI